MHDDHSKIAKRDGAVPGMAMVGCVAGGLGLIGLPFGALPNCVLGAPYYAIMTEILGADHASAHLTIGAAAGLFNPLVGSFIMGVGMVFAPTEIHWHKKWNFTWGDRSLMIPWGFEKT